MGMEFRTDRHGSYFRFPRAYCIKRISQPRKRSESKQMSIYFSAVKKGLFPLFREFIARKSTFISFSRNFIAMKTVAIQMKTVARAIKTVIVATSFRNFFWIFGTPSVFVSKYSILRELRFITLPPFPLSGNQTARISRRARHPISPLVNQES